MQSDFVSFAQALCGIALNYHDMRQQEICSKGTFQLKTEKCAFPSIAVSAIIFEGIIIAMAILIVVK